MDLKDFESVITDKYAIYNCDTMALNKSLPDKSIGMIIYSPPFYDVMQYSSSPLDLSNCSSYQEFLDHYEFVIKENSRVIQDGRHCLVHCMPISKSNGGFIDFPGDIIRLHQKHGFEWYGTRSIWKEPLRVAIRTRSLGLRHSQLTKDTSKCNCAVPDYLIDFRKKGECKNPIEKPYGLTEYHGSDTPRVLEQSDNGEYIIEYEDALKKYDKWEDGRTNKLSHEIWRRYASSVWYDIRIDKVLEYRPARETEEEKHACPLQLDVINRCVVMWSNPNDIVLTNFLGVGSEVFGAVYNGRRGVGSELKTTYFNQAAENIKKLDNKEYKQMELF